MNESPKKRGLFPAIVVGNDTICREHFRLTLAVGSEESPFPPTGPGQFVQLGTDEPRTSADEPDQHPWASESNPGLRTRSLVAPMPLLRRPFSLAGDRPDPSNPAVRHLEIIGRTIGIGTRRLAQLTPGSRIDLIGPLGNRFPMPAAGQTAVLVGGGVGIPPMIYLAEAVRRLGHPAVAVAGVTTAEFLPLTCDYAAPLPAASLPALTVAEFARYGVPTAISSDDGSVGIKGLVTDALRGVLDGLAQGTVPFPDAQGTVPFSQSVLGKGDCPPSSRDFDPSRIVIYTCGPERMMRAVSELAAARSILAWVAMERAMACGIGTCQSCVCKVRAGDAKRPSDSRAGEWMYKLVCTDGPVFDGRDIVWE